MNGELSDPVVVAVEGAGASRYFSRDTTEIVDLMGLNDGDIAHAKGDADRLCAALRRKPAYFLLPDPFVGNLSKVLKLEALWLEREPAYAQSEEPYPLRVQLLKLEEIHPRFAARCGLNKPTP